MKKTGRNPDKADRFRIARISLNDAIKIDFFPLSLRERDKVVNIYDFLALANSVRNDK